MIKQTRQKALAFDCKIEGLSAKTSYIRDNRSPRPKNKNVSKVMSANKAKDTRPELTVRKFLWKSGFRGYRLHRRNLPGRPDIAFFRWKLAIFVHGCFWHRCPHCNLQLPNGNRKFWSGKFEMNIKRDLKKLELLKNAGWHSFVIWECEVNNNSFDKLLSVITTFHENNKE